MRTKYLFFFGLLLICFYCKDFNKFSSGSYPYAEIYIINKPEGVVINKIIKLKEENLNYKVPKLQWAGKDTELLDGRDSHWYYFYFYFKNTNEIVEFWTREGDQPNETKIGLFRVSKGLEGVAHLVNKDLSKEKNEQLKELFKENIISKIK
ncbi:hypothetical protein CLU96_2472 [Chryseobacterium sp. 52]|uniref:hypothetical protein n=1 Tax=Chryseobacterium sp. 52 TaxID=2035213 RepID=UPI000C3EFC7F|nr:hypothetical protein [Chryseobacterium sp. 52]PIF45467.1 hypothetical protein CLU96_2472 [Chryseobacterium sp. 52]